MTQPKKVWLYPALLGIILGLVTVGVPYAVTTPEWDGLKVAIALGIITFLTVGMIRWGDTFFEMVSNLLNQSGLY